MCFIADDHLPCCTRASCMAGTPTAVPYLVDRETNTWTIRLRSVPTRQKNATLGAARAAATRPPAAAGAAAADCLASIDTATGSTCQCVRSVRG